MTKKKKIEKLSIINIKNTEGRVDTNMLLVAIFKKINEIIETVNNDK